MIATQSIIYGFAVIGAIVVAVLGLITAYLLTAAGTIALRRFFDWAAAKVFFAFGGKAYRDGEGRLPRAPWDRVWIEIRWLSGVCQWLQDVLGMKNWVGNPAKRPDMDKFREARAKSDGIERSTLSDLYSNH